MIYKHEAPSWEDCIYTLVTSMHIKSQSIYVFCTENDNFTKEVSWSLHVFNTFQQQRAWQWMSTLD